MSKKHILIAVCGLTPQVITETIYYFYKIKKQPIKEVYVITTLPGKEKIKEALLKQGILNKLCKTLKINKDFKFGKDTIYLVTDKKGNPLDDIRTIYDNERVAEVIWDVVKEHTDREDVVVHCSVAGGRKTMGVYAGLVMSLLGRKHDTLSHILVDEKKESSDFYFPLSKADEDKLSLAEIPYLKLRELFNITEKKLNFVQRIRNYQKELDEGLIPKKVKITYEDKILDAGRSGRVKFSEREFFIYSLFAYKRKGCSCKNGCSKCFLDVSSITKEIPQHLKRYSNYFTQPKIFENMTKENIYEIITRIHTKIEKEDIFKKEFFKIQKHGKRQNLRYGLSIPSQKIVLEL